MEQDGQLRALALRQTVETTRYLCPSCSATRSNKTDRPLSVTLKGNQAAWFCHHCGYKGGTDLTDRPQPRIAVAPVTADNNPAFSYLASRGITKRTAVDAGITYEPTHWVNGKSQRVIGFPYVTKGAPYAVKWRGIDEKCFTQTGAANTFYQVHRIEKGKPLVICEGEIDCLSLWQAGIPAVSVPNGAPQQVSNGRSSPMEDKKYQYVWAAKELIEASPKIIIATDSDPQGEALGEELARRFGRAKCWKVLWPEHTKDANDTLRQHGPALVRERVEQAKPWPVKGLYEALHFRDGVEHLYAKGLIRGESTGFPAVDEVYTVMPGQLCVVTGIPSMGKSAFVDQMMTNLAKRQGWRFAVCSFENEPRVHIAKLMQLHSGKPFFDGPTPRITEAEKEASFSWVQEHFSFLYQGDGQQSGIDDILDRLRAAVMRYGIRGAVIDPYNFIDRDKDTSETDWVSDMLTKAKVFIMAHDVHLWFVAHPFKLRRGDDGRYAVPGGYDISGSAHWFNKADMGVTVHRPDFLTNQSDIHVWKSRYNWIGKPGKATLMYQSSTGEYYEPQTAWQPFVKPSTPKGDEPWQKDSGNKPNPSTPDQSSGDNIIQLSSRGTRPTDPDFEL